MNNADCTLCDDGYYRQDDGYCYLCERMNCQPFKCSRTSQMCLDQLCLPGFTWNNTARYCSQSSCTRANCEYCNGSTCHRCAYGFYLNGSSCSSCTSISNCSRCSNVTNRCVQCNGNRYIHRLDNGNVECRNCSTGTSNCVTCHPQTGRCITCSANYTLNHSGSCIQCSTINCQNCRQDRYECSRCNAVQESQENVIDVLIVIKQID